MSNAAYTHAYTSGPSGAFMFGGMGPTSAGTYYYPYYYPFTAPAVANTTANAVAGPSRGRTIEFYDPELWITQARSSGDLQDNNVARPAVSASSSRVQTTAASSSQVDARQTKKRKLDGT
ncbi:hypothetical protein BDR07DRAFT_1394270, partial [Suillus spraguei]